MSDALQFRHELSSPPDLSPEGVSRRRFLQYALAGATVAGAGVSFGFRDAFGAGSGAPTDRILVIVELLGGNDGLDTVAPVDSGRYRDLRGGIAVTASAGLRIDEGLALHPSLSYLKQRYDQGDLGIIQGIGYPNSTLSHFDSMAMWMGGQHGLEPGRRPETGWIGRYLDSLGAQRNELHAVAFDTSIPLHMRGREAKAVTLRTGALPEFGTTTSGSWLRMYDAVRRMDAGTPSSEGPWADALARAGSQAIDLAGDLAPAYGRPLSGGAFAQEMVQAARLINVDVGVRVITVQASGFDNHRRLKWDHAVALQTLNDGIADFFGELHPAVADRVAVMTFSEFGRRPQKNASGGTDHGTASVAFVLGGGVVGGLYGVYPSLSALDQRGNLVPELDFRDLYGTVAEAWLGADGASIVGGRYEGLPLFGVAPSGGVGTAVSPLPVSSVVAKPAPSPVARQGYLVLHEDGQVQNFGKHATFGSATSGVPVAIRRHPIADGYWIAAASGAVDPFGAVSALDSLSHLSLNAPVVDMAVHPTGEGAWLAASDGGVFALGQAGFYGHAVDLDLVAPITGIAAHPQGGGYWLCSEDGGIFSYGEATFQGSAASIALAGPAVAIAAHPGGNGYWILTNDGGVFTFGDAGFHGSLGGIRLSAPAIDIAATPSGNGYWIVGRDGGVFTLGDAVYHGAPAAAGAAAPAVSISG